MVESLGEGTGGEGTGGEGTGRTSSPYSISTNCLLHTTLNCRSDRSGRGEDGVRGEVVVGAMGGGIGGIEGIGGIAVEVSI